MFEQLTGPPQSQSSLKSTTPSPQRADFMACRLVVNCTYYILIIHSKLTTQTKKQFAEAQRAQRAQGSTGGTRKHKGHKRHKGAETHHPLKMERKLLQCATFFSPNHSNFDLNRYFFDWNQFFNVFKRKKKWTLWIWKIQKQNESATRLLFSHFFANSTHLLFSHFLQIQNIYFFTFEYIEKLFKSKEFRLKIKVDGFGRKTVAAGRSFFYHFPLRVANFLPIPHKTTYEYRFVMIRIVHVIFLFLVGLSHNYGMPHINFITCPGEVATVEL